jgi:putative SOS response-associated peptidase YedK
MCNDYRNRLAYRDYLERLRQLRLPLVRPTPAAAPNLEPRDDIRPTDPAPVIRATEGGVELVEMRWGLLPRPGGRGGPVTNFRSEGRRFQDGRCLVPAEAFYEFTGTRSPKTKWAFTVAGEPWFCIAGIWRPAPEAGEPPRFTMLTTAPGPDVAPYHDRQVVVLREDQWAAWLAGGAPAAALLAPSPAGTLEVERLATRSRQPTLL